MVVDGRSALALLEAVRRREIAFRVPRPAARPKSALVDNLPDDPYAL